MTRKLTELGAQNLVDGRNPISFCNVLFVGNLGALWFLSLIYYRQWRIPLLRSISLKNWLVMAVVAVLGAVVVPTLVFTALDLTNVNNVILLGQIDTPLALALSVWLLSERINRWVVASAIVSFIGVALTVILQPPSSDAVSMMGVVIGRAELYVLIAAVFKVVANLISKMSLQQIPLGIFSGFRMLVGTIVFFVATIILYGAEHFMDVTSPFLWQWMLLYSAIIVVGGQLLWFSGLKRSNASEVSFATAFNPLAGILAAYVLLGEIPTKAQYIGGAVILCGIVLNQISVQKLSKTSSMRKKTAPEMDEAIAFKGI